METGTESSEDTDGQEWNEVDGRRRNELKRRQQRRRRKELKATTARKAANIIGLGPLGRDTGEYQEGQK